MQQRGGPGHDAAEVMADEHRALSADVIEQADDVGAQFDDVVGLDGLRLGRPAVAALVGCQHVVADFGQRGNLMAPRVGQLGKAVSQNYDRRTPLAGLYDP
jgi:hypothetical protein